MITIEAVLRRDRTLVVGCLLAVTALAWVYLVDMAVAMGELGGAMGMAMTEMSPWSAMDFLAMFIMWAVMMVGMMLPGAGPMILMFARVSRRNRDAGGPLVPTAVFATGYAVAWTAFSLVATILQWQLNAFALLSPMMVSTSGFLTGAILLAAGIYQWTPWKHACLRNCRSPIDFILHRWRAGRGGALRMGIEHGAYCVGCCWFLMGLLFAGGVMNLFWVAAIAAFVMVEKVLPRGTQIANASGVVLVGLGVYLLYAGLPASG